MTYGLTQNGFKVGRQVPVAVLYI
ncbi:hypothetical protein [Prevotella multiformis]|nr:hypothetical protein [Prevotella multiformis]